MAATAFASAHEHRRLMQKGVVVDLLDEEIRHVGARDEPACPIARIGQRAIGVSLWPIGQDHGTHDHPLELAPADDPFLHVLVVSHDPPDGISTGRQIEYATVEEEYAARMTFVQKAPAVRISRGVFPVQRLNACVKGRIASDPALLYLLRPFSVHGSDEQIFGGNEQILVQGQSDQEAEKTYRQRGAAR